MLCSHGYDGVQSATFQVVLDMYLGIKNDSCDRFA